MGLKRVEILINFFFGGSLHHDSNVVECEKKDSRTKVLPVLEFVGVVKLIIAFF